jgi:hypothetical protein
MAKTTKPVAKRKAPAKVAAAKTKVVKAKVAAPQPAADPKPETGRTKIAPQTDRTRFVPNRPKAKKHMRYRFVVRGCGPMTFPLDMLRYDCCWPRRSEGVQMIGLLMTPGFPANGQVREVELTGVAPPNYQRWRSFGWTVIDVTEYSA